MTLPAPDAVAQIAGPRYSGPHDVDTAVQLLMVYAPTVLGVEEVRAELGWGLERTRATLRAAVAAGRIEAIAWESTSGGRPGANKPATLYRAPRETRA